MRSIAAAATGSSVVCLLPDRTLARTSAITLRINAICGSNEPQWARQDSNLGPTDYESAALTN